MKLTPEERAQLRELLSAVFFLNWDLEKPDPAVLTRRSLRHTIKYFKPDNVDNYDDFYSQASSQWDAPSHVAHREFGYYNGRTDADFTGRPGSRNGVDH